jgi:hypothetical protein
MSKDPVLLVPGYAMCAQPPKFMKSYGFVAQFLWGSIWAALFMALSGSAAHAQSKQVWPETSTYVKVNDKVRFYFLMTTVKEEKDSTEAEVGPNVDFFIPALKNVKKWSIFPVDESRNQFLTLRMGYRYIFPFTEEGSTEHRGVLELTARHPLVRGAVISDRNRLDIRSIEGTESWRYRNRLTIEREFSIGRFRFNPYARGEIYYDSRYDKISRWALIGGATIPVTRHFEFESYFEHQLDSGGNSNRTVNAVGLVANLYF